MGKKEVLSGLKNITIPALEDRSCKEVWVLNATKPRGQIELSVARPSGGVMIVHIANTWAPQNLTEQVTKKMLMDSPDFRQLVGKKHIILVDEKSARAATDNEDVQKELDRISAESGNSSENLEGKGITDAMVDAGANCSPFVIDLLGREANQELTEVSLLSMLEDREDELTREDLQFIVNKTAFGKVKRWSADTLNNMEDDGE